MKRLPFSILPLLSNTIIFVIFLLISNFHFVQYFYKLFRQFHSPSGVFDRIMISSAHIRQFMLKPFSSTGFNFPTESFSGRSLMQILNRIVSCWWPLQPSCIDVLYCIIRRWCLPCHTFGFVWGFPKQNSCWSWRHSLSQRVNKKSLDNKYEKLKAWLKGRF